jgi:hypothetical protein|tara:strand:- start:554 stop:712 length:159 start_codon:yes stop_codon:yes gene_type:complete
MKILLCWVRGYLKKNDAEKEKRLLSISFQNSFLRHFLERSFLPVFHDLNNDE